MRFSRLTALLVTLTTVAASLVIAAPAEADSTPESVSAPWSCTHANSAGRLVYLGRFLYSNTTGNRVSIDRVLFDSATWTPAGGSARRVAFTSAGAQIWDGHGTKIRDNYAGEPWSGATAVFHWPQKWLWGTKPSPIMARLDATAGISTASFCTKEFSFWG